VILLPEAVRIYVAAQPVNLRKSFEGLSNEVRSALAKDPLSGHLFLFLNRTRSQMKILMFTRGGYTIVHKRLERGRFTFPDRLVEGATSLEIDTHELSMLLEGLEVGRTRSATRWMPVMHA
jgi:transposase